MALPFGAQIRPGSYIFGMLAKLGALNFMLTVQEEPCRVAPQQSPTPFHRKLKILLHFHL